MCMITSCYLGWLFLHFSKNLSRKTNVRITYRQTHTPDEYITCKLNSLEESRGKAYVKADGKLGLGHKKI